MPSTIRIHVYVCSIVYICRYCVCSHGSIWLTGFSKKHFLSCSVRRDEKIPSDIVKDIHLFNCAIHIV